ncbi:MAG: acyltransferase family protein [Pyrinomonadaceae bacterium]|nr:acyltransferase family protein [Sphingobacteriaceae bacterium]
MERNYSVDTLRTICASLIVLLHSSNSYLEKGLASNRYDWFFLVDSCCRISVPIFVLLSGRFLLGRNEPVGAALNRRFSKIVIPIAFWSFLYLLYQSLGHRITKGNFNLDELAIKLIKGKPFDHLWFLYMILGLYFIAPFLNYSIPHISRKGLFKLAFFFTVLGAFLHIYDMMFNNNIFFALTSVKFMGFFLYGYLMKDMKEVPIKLLFLAFLLSNLSIAAITYFTEIKMNSFYFYSRLSPFVIISALSIYKIFCQLNLRPNFVSKIAYLTFGINLIHAGVLDLLNFYLKRREIIISSNPYMEISGKFIFALLVSITIAYIFSRNKLLKQLI